MRLYVDRVIDHVDAQFPETCASLGPAAIRARVVASIERGRQRGFASERDLCLFVDLGFMLGPQFDVDPALPWASATIENDLLPDPSDRMDELYERALEHLRAAPATPGRRDPR